MNKFSMLSKLMSIIMAITLITGVLLYIFAGSIYLPYYPTIYCVYGCIVAMCVAICVAIVTICVDNREIIKAYIAHIKEQKEQERLRAEEEERNRIKEQIKEQIEQKRLQEKEDPTFLCYIRR